ncbi:MAG: hypothetical protein JWM87_767 [Candidatus Eremiobacteraeota bacterium]|nr:hypothetical protein [Candidatus Eremiobacteraeota bacterium]
MNGAALPDPGPLSDDDILNAVAAHRDFYGW